MSEVKANRYLTDLFSGFWDYRERFFGAVGDKFETIERHARRPPVFISAHADDNVLVRPGASEVEAKEVRAQIPIHQRHRWFGSMRSSQALAQSLFGNLLVLGRLDVLAGLPSENGGPAFFASASGWTATLEYAVTHLGEPTPTSVDVFFTGSARIAVECKLAEVEIGSCSRPRLPSTHREFCDGSYAAQASRTERCALTARGIKYWDYVPQLLHVPNDVDHRECPLNGTYQLVRNVLAASVLPDGSFRSDGGHALLLYDARNPAFAPGGTGFEAFDAVTARLRHPDLLRRCSWQQVFGWIARHDDLAWLTSELSAKYGIAPGGPASL